MEDQPDNSGSKTPGTPLRDHGAGYPTQPGATNFSLPSNAQFTFPPTPYYTNTPIQPTRNFNAPYPTPNLSAPRLYPTPQMLPPTWTARYPSQTASAPPESHTPSNMARPLPRPLGGQPRQPPSRSTIPRSRSPATVTPRPVDSDSDLPEVSDIMRPNSKDLGKRKAREDTDEPGEITRPSSKVLGKRKARDNTDEPPKKKRVAKDSKPGTSKAKVKAEPVSKAKQKGRSSGSRNFSSEEIHRLLRGINTRLPIGGKGWEAVAEAYNSWAAKQGYSQRTAQSIKGKFDTIVREAKEKPTGDAERSDDDPRTIALEIEDRIAERSGTLALDDPEFSEGGMKSNGDSDDDRSVIEIASDSEKENRGKGKKGLLAKAYRVERPLADKRKPHNASATDALDRMTSSFNPDRVRERDNHRMAQSIQLTQLSSAQLELRELRARNDALHDRVLTEARRADRAENELQLLRALQNQQHGQRRSRGSSYQYRGSGSDSDAVYEHVRSRRHCRQPHRSISPPRLQLDGRRERRYGGEDELDGSFTISAPTTSTSRAQPIASTSRHVFEAHQPQQSTPPHWVASPPQVAVTPSASRPTNFVITPRRTHDGISIDIKTPTQSLSNPGPNL